MFKVEDRAVNETGSPFPQVSYSLVRETDEQIGKYNIPCAVPTSLPKRSHSVSSSSSHNFLSGLPILSLPVLQFIPHAGATRCGYKSDRVTYLFKKPSYLRSRRLKAQAGAKWARLKSQPSFLEAGGSRTSSPSALSQISSSVTWRWYQYLVPMVVERNKWRMPIKC